MKKWIIRGVVAMFAAALLVIIGSHIIFRPSLTRNWTLDQKVLARTTFNDDSTVSIQNVRNIEYRSTSDYTPDYYDATYDPKKIKRAWFLVEPFGSLGAAHTLVSFEFEDGRFLSVSAEIRKEIGESFSPIKGLLNQYELVYVIADERDVIRLRTNFRKDDVYLYPIKGEKEVVQDIFLSMLKRANTLAEKPEMYNTLTNNCTTNIVSHVRDISEKEIPWWDFRYLAPENVDTLVYELGLIDTGLSFEDARKEFYITTRAQNHTDLSTFSETIRR